MSTTIHSTTAEDEAIILFSETYGLGLVDAMRAVCYCRRRGSEKTARALALVSATGCSFTDAARAVEDADAQALAKAA